MNQTERGRLWQVFGLDVGLHVSVCGSVTFLAEVCCRVKLVKSRVFYFNYELECSWLYVKIKSQTFKWLKTTFKKLSVQKQNAECLESLLT